MRPLLLVVAACSAPAAKTPVVAPVSAPPTVDAAAPSQDEVLAAIQKAMNDLSPAAQGCWAAAAVERFDIEGELAAQIDIGERAATVTLARDTANNPGLSACLVSILTSYRWAPPLHGQSIQLPFKFSAPDGQSVIDRRLVPWHGQGKVSIAVLLDENNTGNAAASMFEVAIADDEWTATRTATRAELWVFLGDGDVMWGPPDPKPPGHAVRSGDMMFVPAGGERSVTGLQGFRAVVVTVPGGREGAARAGALATPIASGHPRRDQLPIVLPASRAKTYGPATIFLDASIVKATPLAASIIALPAGAKVPEHVHPKETELLYVLAGSGTLTVAGTDVAVTPTSVIQIPPNTKHAFVAAEAVRAIQIYTPAGPEQRFKK